jgi:GH25 family lysozyme M1 (1,4-beta-N-acetylmuramidase)
MFGTDVSQHNTLNAAQFSKLRDGGIEFCTVRASIGSANDTKAVEYSELADNASMIVGAYHYLRAGSQSPVDTQADRFKRALDSLPFVNWVVLDVEDPGTTQLDVAMFVAAFGNPDLGLYTNPAWLANLPDVQSMFKWNWIARYIEPQEPIWLSNIQNTVLTNPPSRLWQFSQKLTFTVSGVKANVDADVFDGDKVELLRYTGAIS